MSTTPLIPALSLAKALGINNKIFLKREDLHPFGSHKGRSIPLMIEKYFKDGIENFVVSSSGNAALAAGLYIKKHNQKNKKHPLSLQILVGGKIPADKLKLLKKLLDNNISIQQLHNPKQIAFQLEKNKQAHWLRQSTDDAALIGYESLAKELSKIKNLQTIFIPTSSGTTAEGLYKGFKKIKINPQIHIIQTTACHPIAEIINPEEIRNTPTSIAGAIVDQVAHRKAEVKQAVEESGGKSWIATDTEIRAAIKLMFGTEKIKISANSALSLVGLKKAVKQKIADGTIVILITGQ